MCCQMGVDLERRCQDTSREMQMLTKKEVFPRPRVQDRAGERLQDQIIEEVKELEHTKTEEALQLASKEHDLWMTTLEKRGKKTAGRQESEEGWNRHSLQRDPQQNKAYNPFSTMTMKMIQDMGNVELLELIGCLQRWVKASSIAQKHWTFFRFKTS